MANIQFVDNAWKEYLSWSNDKATQKKINQLIKEISRTPFNGTGKPEPLKNDLEKRWSRRINEEDRLVYKYENEIVIIYQCRGHYDDK
ncbi:MAG: Txe/YoeB family addiction module toxin [Lachnospiraceae bacterium]|nr:Txe/YoeB family addiction module toxin [Clostridia bacterium]MBP3200760.1 Txe/YoeB family addiction module toxin [Lachnospiraceae bacterium]